MQLTSPGVTEPGPADDVCISDVPSPSDKSPSSSRPSSGQTPRPKGEREREVKRGFSFHRTPSKGEAPKPVPPKVCFEQGHSSAVINVLTDPSLVDSAVEVGADRPTEFTLSGTSASSVGLPTEGQGERESGSAAGEREREGEAGRLPGLRIESEGTEGMGDRRRERDTGSEVVHEVGFGESLHTIALQYPGIPAYLIRRVNDIRGQVRPGMVLTIPQYTSRPPSPSAQQRQIFGAEFTPPSPKVSVTGGTASKLSRSTMPPRDTGARGSRHRPAPRSELSEASEASEGRSLLCLRALPDGSYVRGSLSLAPSRVAFHPETGDPRVRAEGPRNMTLSIDPAKIRRSAILHSTSSTPYPPLDLLTVCAAMAVVGRSMPGVGAPVPLSALKTQTKTQTRAQAKDKRKEKKAHGEGEGKMDRRSIPVLSLSAMRKFLLDVYKNPLLSVSPSLLALFGLRDGDPIAYLGIIVKGEGKADAKTNTSLLFAAPKRRVEAFYAALLLRTVSRKRHLRLDHSASAQRQAHRLSALRMAVGLFSAPPHSPQSEPASACDSDREGDSDDQYLLGITSGSESFSFDSFTDTEGEGEGDTHVPRMHRASTDDQASPYRRLSFEYVRHRTGVDTLDNTRVSGETPSDTKAPTPNHPQTPLPLTDTADTSFPLRPSFQTETVASVGSPQTARLRAEIASADPSPTPSHFHPPAYCDELVDARHLVYRHKRSVSSDTHPSGGRARASSMSHEGEREGDRETETQYVFRHHNPSIPTVGLTQKQKRELALYKTLRRRSQTGRRQYKVEREEASPLPGLIIQGNAHGAPLPPAPTSHDYPSHWLDSLTLVVPSGISSHHVVHAYDVKDYYYGQRSSSTYQSNLGHHVIQQSVPADIDDVAQEARRYAARSVVDEALIELIHGADCMHRGVDPADNEIIEEAFHRVMINHEQREIDKRARERRGDKASPSEGETERERERVKAAAKGESLRRPSNQAMLRKVSFSDPSVTSSILSPEALRLVQRYLPGLLPNRSWSLIYATHTHGSSLASMYRCVAERQGQRTSTDNSADSIGDNRTGTVMLIKTSRGEIMGGFTTGIWQPYSGKNVYAKPFGSPASFVFSAHPSAKVHTWSGKDRFFQLCGKDYLAIGGGGGFAIKINGLTGTNTGTTSACDTFNSMSLIDGQDHRSKFTVAELELWGFDP
ncbi:hypothetical protein KIPB_000194 [Kipferlia bialata]|uniref:Oxidation resistance protein 1 n=1 Tax=Kipferlia bialata TaxID=797122 RepID=A0A9K3CNF4_9EUKA|nr:hypothetical protein KIPB_000194 [Kipferlia bialata]|eukprot:g194.t1